MKFSEGRERAIVSQTNTGRFKGNAGEMSERRGGVHNNGLFRVHIDTTELGDSESMATNYVSLSSLRQSDYSLRQFDYSLRQFD